MLRHLPSALGALLFAGALMLGPAGAQARQESGFLESLAVSPSLSASTVPANGDQNPYGVAQVPFGFPGGTLHAGDILVSNFNNGGNQQGTGTTIVNVHPNEHVTTFFTAPPNIGPVGLTTALVALRSGLVVVGNTPTTDGTPATLGDGSLLFLDQSGHLLLNFTDATLRGPWDMTADERNPMAPILYISTVRNGTVVRLQLHVTLRHGAPMPVVDHATVVASGFSHRTDPNALVVGPTGLLLGDDGETLYVADTGNNRIQALHDVRAARGDQGAGRTILSGAPLKGPLALAWTPKGTIVASNGDAAGDAATPPNMVVEFEPHEHEVVSTRQLDTSGTPGGIFGIAVGAVNGRFALIFVNDNTATLNVLPMRVGHM